ncbi:MAG: hypothetical protein CSA66_02540 [Proteobacteria bacterium]|nr:MAG: hypothetical protein CSA66_02540 [Pseudomonadota bacterium]
MAEGDGGTGALLARLRAALEPGRAAAMARPAFPEQARLVGPGEDLVARFTAAAEAVGVEVVEARPAGVEAAVTAILEGAKASRVAIDGATGLPPRGDAGDPFALEAAVTSVAGAVAETGSLVIDSGALPLTWSLTPALHVAVIPAGRIVATLVDALGGRDAEPQPGQRVLVTGPSKTADIEGVLITGVHGPGRVVAVVVRGC